MENRLVLGCIADDFTGGSDAASFLAAGGMRTVLLAGLPPEGFVLPEGTEAAVITLKSRTQEPQEAVRDSLQALLWLKAAGASRFYLKYCSTFDSTPRGNIGPVTDACLEELGEAGTILCPALPANGRTVKDGILYVKGVPLAESPMKDHPLTPMRESRISLLMKPQGKYECLELDREALSLPEEALRDRIAAFAAVKEHWYLVPDCETDADAARITDCFGDMRFLTGGSGILEPLGQRLKPENKTAYPVGKASAGTAGKAVLVAGSCSTATHAQTLWYEKQGGRTYRLSDVGILSGKENAERIWEQVRDAEAPLVYAYDSPEGLAKKRDEDGRRLAAAIEDVLAQTVVRAVQDGAVRIISAGGETSGAVTKALGYRAYFIGRSVAPGVPVMIPVENPKVRLVLKSGNFGQEDFFARALAMTGE